jgi:hypothetical protein
VADDRALDHRAGLDQGAGAHQGVGHRGAAHVDLADAPHAPAQGAVADRTGGRWPVPTAEQQVEVGPQVGVGRPGVEPVDVGAEGVERLGLGQGREGLALDRHATAGRDPGQDAGLEHVGAGVDEVGGCLVPRGLLDEGLDPAVGVGRDDPEGGRVLDGGEADGGLGAVAAVEGDQRGDVQVGQDVAVDHHEGVVDPGVVGGEADGPGGVERAGLDGVGEPDPGRRPAGIGAHEGVRPVAEGQDGVVDAVIGQVGQHPLDHRLLHDGEHLLGRGERQRTQACALPTHQDDRSHRRAPA